MIRYKSGATIPHADALSRLRFTSDSSSAEDMVINNLLVDPALPKQLMEHVRCESKKWSACSQRLRPFLRTKELLHVKDGLLYLHLPPALRKDAFNSAHELHFGMRSTLRRLEANVCWPHMKKDVFQWVAKCSSCNQLRPQTAKGKSSWPTCAPFENK